MEFNALNLIYETYLVALSVKKTYYKQYKEVKVVAATLFKTSVMFPAALFSHLRHFVNLVVAGLTKIDVHCGRCSLWPAALV